MGKGEKWREEIAVFLWGQLQPCYVLLEIVDFLADDLDACRNVGADLGLALYSLKIRKLPTSV